MDPPAVAIVIPTRNRADYLERVLASLACQDADCPHEVCVVDDGSSDATPAVVERFGVRLLRHPVNRGLNAARNAGVTATTAPLIAFLDDDVDVPPGWLRALVQGVARHPEADAFGGPIRARLEGRPPRSCGREKPPITTLDLGAEDAEVEMVWGANLVVRRGAFDRLGPFDERISGHGDEEDWLLALRASGGRIVYLAAAGVEHRRSPADARLLPLARAAYHRGRGAGITDQRRGTAPSLLTELRVLTGCVWHTVHYRCPQGTIWASHSAGRIAASLRRDHGSGGG